MNSPRAPHAPREESRHAKRDARWWGSLRFRYYRSSRQQPLDPPYRLLRMGMFTMKTVIACGFLLFGAASFAAEPKLTVLASSVAQYERVEFTIAWDRAYRNPFDPDEVAMTLYVGGPAIANPIAVPAFFGQQYRREPRPRAEREEHRDDRRDWMYPKGMPGWQARFAGKAGSYEAWVEVKDAEGIARSNRVAFEIRPAAGHGYVRVSPTDPRYFAFDDGTPYFAIGHNHAFVGEAQYANLARSEQIFANIGRNGGNFLRIWVCCHDWATAVEARKSAWGRTWAWNPPIVPRPGDPSGQKCLEITAEKSGQLAVQPTHPLAVLPATEYVVSGTVLTEPGAKVAVLLGNRPLGEPVGSEAAGKPQWVRFAHKFTTGKEQLWLEPLVLRRDGTGRAWLDGLSLREAAGGSDLLWEADVNRPERGFYNPVDCFVVDQLLEAAERTRLYLQLTFVTRDLYMAALKDPNSREYRQAIDDVKKLARYCVARWGYSTHLAAWEYFNEIDPGLPTDLFYDELGRHFEAIDPWRHLRTTSCWHPSPKDWKHSRLDVAQAHHYLQPNSKLGFRDEVDGGLKAIEHLVKNAHGKPALMAEFGLAENNCQLSGYMKQDKELIHFHNALWMSALSGTAGTVAFWWWDQLDQMDGYRHYRPLADFVADIPWTTANLQPSSAKATENIRVVGLQGKDRAYLWLYNPAACWWNVAIEKKQPAEVQTTLTVEGLTPGNYRVIWWDTWQGKPLGEQRAVVRPHAEHQEHGVRLRVPVFRRDLACKIVPAE